MRSVPTLGTERHGPLHYSLDEAIMSQKQFEVVKCFFSRGTTCGVFVFCRCLFSCFVYFEVCGIHN